MVLCCAGVGGVPSARDAPEAGAMRCECYPGMRSAVDDMRVSCVGVVVAVCMSRGMCDVHSA